MKTQFKLELLKFTTITELPNSWQEKHYKELLEVMDFDGIEALAATELKEMCYMSLTDYEPEAAAELVLGHTFKDRLNAGQIQNLSNEMLDEKLWEEYADIAMHEDFFIVGQLLYEAFNGKFPHPEAVRFQVKVSAMSEAELDLLHQNPEATLIRLLVKGMPENTLIHRLFDEQLEGAAFPEAVDIIWQLKRAEGEDKSVVFDVISSEYWFHDFKYAEAFEVDVRLR